MNAVLAGSGGDEVKMHVALRVDRVPETHVGPTRLAHVAQVVRAVDGYTDRWKIGGRLGFVGD